MTATPLAVLDLLPLSQGDTPRDAVRNAVDLARRAEEFGYRRYWFAEHHLHPGVLGVSPAVAIALVGHATDTIRLGSAGVQFGHRTPLSAVEEFGLLDAQFPGRIDLGIGRSPGRRAPSPQDDTGAEAGAQAIRQYAAGRGTAPHDADAYTSNGILIPRLSDFAARIDPARFGALLGLLQQPGAWTPDYDGQIGTVLDLLSGTYRSPDGVAVHAHPGEGADVELWVLGVSAGESARVAGARGLRFAVSYHHSPSTVLDAVAAYREAFRPSADLAAPYVSVSADAVVAEDDGAAHDLAAGYGLWVRSIRRGLSAIPFPPPDEALAHAWTDEDRDLVRDRIRTQVVGSPETVADGLARLRDATGADEVAVTTITHRHEDRVRSYELLAKAWAGLG